jgi:hypothetical protein
MKRYPFNIAITRLFDNCTVHVGDTADYVEVILCGIYCKNVGIRKGGKIMIVTDGIFLMDEKICEACTHYLKHLVNECGTDISGKSDCFIEKSKRVKPAKIKDEFFQFTEVKRGYILYSNFDTEIGAFSVDHVRERIEDFQDQGRFVSRKIREEERVCKTCVQYKTKMCDGLHRHSIDTQINSGCKMTKEEFNKKMKEIIKVRYTTMSNALWYYSQCGRTFYFKDPKTKRTSNRYICMPASEKDNGKVNGFIMVFSRYPMKMDKSRYQTFISKKEYIKHMQPRQVKYCKKADESIFAAEAYKESVSPGGYISISGHTNYLAYTSLEYAKKIYYECKEGKKRDFLFCIGAQTSRDNLYTVRVADIKELLAETRDVKLFTRW